MRAAAHDAKAPVAVIRAEAAALRAQLRDRDVLAALERIQAAAEKAATRLDVVMTMAVAPGDAAGRPLVTADLAAITRNIAVELQALATAQRVALTVDGPRAVPVRVDPEELASAVQNLVHNALRHSPEGGAVRCVVSRSIVSGRLDVLDGGPGFSAAARRRFEEQRPGPKGASTSGVGLLIAGRVAREAGGQLHVLDGPERGARLVLTLPAAAGAASRLSRNVAPRARAVNTG